VESIERAIVCDDQPISGATLFHEGRYLTSWITPGNLEVQRKYKALTGNLSLKDKIISCWGYVAKQIRYRQFITSRVSVDGRTFVQKDAWLDPAQVIRAGVGNCMNRSVLLTSLLRQALSSEQVYTVLGNITGDGHAWVLVRLDQDYILETTSPNLSSCFIPASSVEAYEPVIFFQDKGVKYFPEKSLHEPFSNCFCIHWLEQYLEGRACRDYI